MRNVSLLCAALLAACASSQQEADRAAIRRTFEEKQAQLRRAWEQRDAKLMLAVDSPQFADVQRRMNLTVRIVEMKEEIESIAFVGADEAMVVSNQRFARVMRLGEGQERERVSTVTHRRRYERQGEKWVASGPLEESNQRAWWADEGPPGR